MAGDSRLPDWHDFYVIVGSAGAALIGIQFVVMTLIASRRKGTNEATIGAFGSPTIMSFANALLISAVMCMPWPSLLGVKVAATLISAAGLIHGCVAIRSAKRQDDYQPVWEDWLWYMILPIAAHLTLLGAAFWLDRDAHLALFLVAACTLGLLLLGVRNAWDSVTHIVITGSNGHQ